MSNIDFEKMKGRVCMAFSLAGAIIGMSLFGAAIFLIYLSSLAEGDGRIARLAMAAAAFAIAWLFMDYASKMSGKAVAHQNRVIDMYLSSNPPRDSNGSVIPGHSSKAWFAFLDYAQKMKDERAEPKDGDA